MSTGPAHGATPWRLPGACPSTWPSDTPTLSTPSSYRMISCLGRPLLWKIFSSRFFACHVCYV
uniref:Uncharacterized protein n=1 Tax=Arundo donax TaxID=35708 RepID=A0A0A9AND0_ARUDO